MSWLFGIISPNLSDNHKSRLEKIHGNSFQLHFRPNKYYFAFGKNSIACYSRPEETESFWIGLGCIIKKLPNTEKVELNSCWQEIASNTKLINSIDGHFVFINYINNTFEIFTDRLGLRTLFWTTIADEIIVSTKLDWIIRYIGKGEIDHKVLGSRWLFFNQISYKSLFKNINRLGPGGHLLIKDNIIHINETPYTPPINQAFVENDATSLITSFITPTFENNTKITFGLSGGLDSRVLLSLFLQNKHKNFITHTFGTMQDPDVIIPKKMAHKEGFVNYSYNKPFPTKDELLSQIDEYSIQTNLIEPISTALRLRNYSEIDTKKFILLDGGFGEIARRQYLNRLALKGKKTIQEKDISTVFNCLSMNRGNFLSQDILLQMEVGAKEEIAVMFDSMPNVNDIGIENYLDLWAVRTRFPNFGSDEQARLDSFILNYMPFAQPSFIDMVFSMPPKLRRDGNLFRKIILNSYPALSTYPLVKSGTTYPFHLSTKTSWLYTKIKKKVGLHYTENHLPIFLDVMKDFILDTVHSVTIKQNPLYHYSKIKNAVDCYYSGEKGYMQDINWWLTFELWRKNIQAHKS